MPESRNIIGESFREYVRNQVKIRQEKLGAQDKDTDLLKYISNKTSWVRLSSGVDIAQSGSVIIRDYNKAVEYESLGAQNFPGNLFAKKSVLFSAYKYQEYPADKNDSWKGEFTHGVGYDLSNPSYGYTSGIGLSGNDINTADKYNYGMVPPAGIISAEIKSRNRGSLRDAIVQISCHNLAQFRVIETLYLKLKYSMLLEWGHTLWYDNKNDLRSDMPDYIHQKFLDGKYDQDSLLLDIENNRKNYCGNYDAFLGWVTNFDWTLRKDGGYDIVLNLISFGDVIESLKVNMNYPGLKENTSEPDNNRPSVIANKNKSTIHQILYAIQNHIWNNNGLLNGFNKDDKSNSLSTDQIVQITKDISKYDLINANYKNPNELWNQPNNILTWKEGTWAKFSSISSNENSTGGIFYYIKLGTLLRIVESFLLKYNTAKGKEGEYKPLFYIDHDYDSNLCLTIPRQISLNPKVCLLSNDTVNQETLNKNAIAKTKYIKIVFLKTSNVIGSSGGGFVEYNYIKQSNVLVESTDPEFSENLIVENEPLVPNADLNSPYKLVYFIKSDFYVSSENSENNLKYSDFLFRVDGFPFIGKFMHLHINLDFISDILSSNIDDKGNVSAYEFLQQLMKGIQSATGNINNFDVTYDEVTNYYVIRDLNIVPDALKFLNRESDITKFNVNLLKKNQGSFILDASIKSTLNNSFASTIAIGAQVNGNKIGENSTALSKLNSGYIDRLITDRSSIMDQNNNDPENNTKTIDPDEIFNQNLLDFNKFINKINDGTVTEDDISNNTQSIIDLYNYELGYHTEQENIPGVGFIPIDLQLTMDGLSGPRIYEVYTIDDELLPESYKNNIQFITIGVNHKINNSKWTTTLNSLSGPKKNSLKLNNINTNTNTNYNPKINNIESPIESSNQNSINNEILREITYLTNTLPGVQYYGADRGIRKHAGVDIDVKGKNAEMISFIGGKVINIGNDPGGYGKYIDIHNESLGIVERIAEANNIKSQLNQIVKKGQIVATGEGTTGVIHYEIRYKNQYDINKFGYDTTTNPLEYLINNGIVTIKPSPVGYDKTEINFKI